MKASARSNRALFAAASSTASANGEGTASARRPTSVSELLSRSAVTNSPQASEDEYNVSAISDVVPGRKNQRLYMLHTYWAKKPFDAIEVFVRHFTKEGDVVLDPFCGCGSTIVSSMMAGRLAIGSDVSPSAVRIASGYCHAHPFGELQAIRDQLIKDVWREIGWLFSVGRMVIRSVVVSEAFRCIRCFREVPLADLGIEEQSDHCPHCREGVNTRTLEYIPNSAKPFEVELQERPLAGRAREVFRVGHSREHDAAFAALYQLI